MNLIKRNVLLIICIFLTPCVFFFFPNTPFIIFAPYLCTVAYKKSLLPLLWNVALLGLFCDLQSYTFPFGFYALCYVLATLPAYRYKHLFFQEKIWSFSLFVLLFSLLFTFLQIEILSSLVCKNPLSVMSLLSYLLLAGVVNFLYALVWVFSPILFKKGLNALKKGIEEYKMKKNIGQPI